MKKNQRLMIALAVAVTAGAGAYMLMPGTPAPVEIIKEIPALAPAAATDEILVASLPLDYGSTLNETSMHWQTWPKSATLTGVILKSEAPNAMVELKDWVVRTPFSDGDPIRRDHLIKGPAVSMMSTLIAPGHRAVAINIDTSGASTAGGFILPNDHVDVLRTFRDEEAAKAGQGESQNTETILRNVRVLAIGPNVTTENGKAVVAGSNATLELDPRQAEFITLAQRTGQLSLILRSMTDAKVDQVTTDTIDNAARDPMMTIIRAGVATTARAR